jgi:hypothetical protein
MTIRLLGHPLCDRNRPAFSRQKPRFLPADAQRFSAGLLKAPQASFSLCHQRNGHALLAHAQPRSGGVF